MGICVRYSADRNEARDILQDGFIKVFSKITQYDKTGSFEGWMQRIIRNTAIDNIRRSKKYIVNPNSDYIEENAEQLVDVDEQEENGLYPDISQNEILTAVQQLPPSCRTVFNMHVVDGIPHPEIANQLGITIGTSKSNLFKAKMNLRKKLLLVTA